MASSVSAIAGGDAEPDRAKPKVSIARADKGRYEARASFDADDDVRVEVGLRLVGRSIEGRRRLLDTASVAEDFGPGRVGVDLPLGGVARAASARCAANSVPRSPRPR